MSNVGLPMRPTQQRRGRARKKPSKPPVRRSTAFPFLIMGMVGLGFLALVAGFLAPRYLSDPAVPDYSGQGSGDVVIEVSPGDTLADVGLKLTSNGVTASSAAFTLAAAKDDNAVNLQPGTYTLHKQMSGKEALNLLMDPSAKKVSGFVIPEGSRMTQVFKIASQATGIPVADFEAVAANPKDLGLPAWANNNPEGFLFPARYEFQPSSTALTLMQGMVAKFNAVARSINLETEAAKQGRTPYEIVTIASLVQAEGHTDDYGKVSRVVYNRLSQGMPLQFDSTSNYASNSSNIQLTDEQKASDSPYNTYLNNGLPPTPIGQPGEEALKAALSPEPGDWLFFVAVDPDKKITKFTSDYNQFLQYSDELLKYLEEHPQATQPSPTQ